MIAVLTGARGRGSNLRALRAAFPDLVRRVIVPAEGTPAGEWAASEGLDVRVVPPGGDYVAALEGASLVVLAGFTRKLPDDVLQAHPGRVINVHPSLLPRHGGPGMWGRRVHEAVLAAGDAESGCTVHRVTSEYDEGEILEVRRCPVLHGDTPETLGERVLSHEHEALPAAVRRILSLP